MKKRILGFLSSLLILTLSTALLASEERLILTPRIEGERVRLAIDTGNGFPMVLLKPTVERLRLKTEEKQGKKIAVFTIVLGGKTYSNGWALVIDAPPFAKLDIDGLFGWPLLRGAVWQIDWGRMSLSLWDSLPEETSSWQMFKLDHREPIAAAFLGENTKGLVYFDTGNSEGIWLSIPRWNQWVRENQGAPMTLTSGYMPAAGGIFWTEQSWSDRFRLGPLTIPGVLLVKSPIKIWPRLEAVLGLEALKHFEVVLDLKESRILMKSRPYAPSNIQYNRLGAAFLPIGMKSEKVVAQVLEKSPAYKAGLRSGDILLKVDGVDMARWKTDDSIAKRGFSKGAPGTEHALEIERDGKKYVIRVELEEILKIPRSGR